MTNSDKILTQPSLLERLAAVSVLATSFALALSFTYDWGFFWALDISFGSAPTSISDHLRTGLLWASQVIPVALLMLVFDLLTRRMNQGMTDDEIIEESPDPQLAIKVIEWPRKVVEYGSLVFLLVWLITGFGPTPLIPATICWMWFMMWVMKHPLVASRSSPVFWLFAFVGPPVLMWFFWMGSDAATAAMSDDPPVIAYIDSCEDGVENCPALRKAGVLRTFQDWLLVRDSSTVYWVRSDDVHRMDVSDDGRTSFSGLMCIVFAKCLPSARDRPLAKPITEERRGESTDGLDR